MYSGRLFNWFSFCSVFAVVLLLWLPTASGDELAESDRCLACHMQEDYLPEGFMLEDVHMQPGLSCAGCHGGDPTSDDEEKAMSEAEGFIGVPSRQEMPQFCGRCHSDIDLMRQYQPRIATDQEEQYHTSVHGQRLREGDGKVAECANCHTAHGIFSARDSRSSVHPLNVPSTCNGCHGDPQFMTDYDIPTDQFEKYARSVHGIALLENEDTGAPACNDCHGNHGAVPPGITSVKQVCGHCHVNNVQYFTASKMGAAFKEEELHGCEECHGNHEVLKTTDDMVGTGDESVCMDCHAEGEEGYEAAAAIHGHLTGLSSLYDEAHTRQKEVHRIGMDDVDIVFLLQEAHQSLIQSRTLVHTFDPEKVGAKTGEGLAKTKEALQLADAQIEEHSVRRRGFGLATVFMMLVVVALFFKIRQMETG